MKQQIKSCIDARVIYECDASTLKEALERGVLEGVDFSYAELNDAELNGAELNRAKLNDAELNDAELNGAELNGAELNGAKLNRAKLNRAKLNDAELNDAELNGAELNGAELNGAIGLTFESFGISGDQSLLIRVAERALSDDTTLEMSDWHCGTSHCMAGLAIDESGAAGYALEAATSPSVAGAMLIPQAAHMFHATNEEAREFLRSVLPDGHPLK